MTYYQKGKALWYQPVFRVITFDGKQVWRRRLYRVRRAKVPGTFYYTVRRDGRGREGRVGFRVITFDGKHVYNIKPMA